MERWVLPRARPLVVFAAALAVALLATLIVVPPAQATYGCPGFPPPAGPGTEGGVCTYGPVSGGDPRYGHYRDWRRYGNPTIYNGTRAIAFVDINSTRCGINWYRVSEAEVRTWVFFTPGTGTRNGETYVPSSLRTSMHVGRWSC
jgi:hypothetical protein